MNPVELPIWIAAVLVVLSFIIASHRDLLLAGAVALILVAMLMGIRA